MVLRVVLLVAAATALAPVRVRPLRRSVLGAEPVAQEAEGDAWTVTMSGLKYVDEVVGDGALASPGTVATVLYTGRLVKSGRVFDSSDGKGAFKFLVGSGSVIPGWEEGIATMRVGGKRRLYVPAALGYGEFGSGGNAMIPKNADLEFDTELTYVGEGAIAAFAAKFSIGYNLRTAILALLALSIVLPPLFPDAAWLH